MIVEIEERSAKTSAEYEELRQMLEDAGLFKPRHAYYLRNITITLLLYAGGWVVFFMLGASWMNLITAGFLSVMATQIAFFGHDAGHLQIFKSKMANTRLSLVLGNLLLGLSTGWWNYKHNRHHAHTNILEKDPDVAVGAFVHTEEQAKDRGKFGRFLSRHQAWLFFPLLLLEGFNLHASSIQAMFGRTIRSKRMRLLESILLLMHLALLLFAVITVLTPVQAVVFIFVNRGLWGLYMGLSFAPNHKGMPYLKVKKGSKPDFLRAQVITSRNVQGNWFIDWLLGGLNYQIPHHLYSYMARPALKPANPIIKAFCEQLGLTYTETTLPKSYREVLGHLDKVGADA